MKENFTRLERFLLWGLFAFLLLQALLTPIFWEPLNFADVIAMLFLLGIVALIIRTKDFPVDALIGISIPFVLHSIGIMGAYANFSFIFTYDKWMHLLSGLGVTLFIIALLSQIPFWQRLLIAFLVAMGLGAITEIAEFIGHQYFGIQVGGLFTFGDGQKQVGSVLQIYDSYFDMIFQACGNTIAIAMHLLLARRKVR